jgi:hypothetical protein
MTATPLPMTPQADRKRKTMRGFASASCGCDKCKDYCSQPHAAALLPDDVIDLAVALGYLPPSPKGSEFEDSWDDKTAAKFMDKINALADDHLEARPGGVVVLDVEMADYDDPLAESPIVSKARETALAVLAGRPPRLASRKVAMRVPVLGVRPADGECPFFLGTGCTVHALAPTPCALLCSCEDPDPVLLDRMQAAVKTAWVNMAAAQTIRSAVARGAMSKAQAEAAVNTRGMTASPYQMIYCMLFERLWDAGRRGPWPEGATPVTRLVVPGVVTLADAFLETTDVAAEARKTPGRK